MYSFSSRALIVFLILFFTASLFNKATAQDKPLLSEAIQNTIDSQGVEAAKEYFSSMDSSERQQYNVDMEGISELTNAYLEDGNMEALMAISEITGVFMQDAVAQSMEQYGAEIDAMEEMAAQREAEREWERMQREEERARERQQSVVERQGEPREDLERFKGVYGDPDDPESTRQLWVNVSCDGYLVSGAMWGDAAPWWMRSESDNVFTMKDSFNNIRMEFGSGTGGFQMNHNLEFMESPLQRLGPLPEDWDSCLERYQ
jgi:hypothetical protein